ncbi:N-acetyltransferase [Candidatus Peregrinibacteria bacterium]|nr:N-acetyltransferase [Candidatus Peregrinibacteria bacterium]MBI3816078.1 N-acetyltransferase [Candidatus Peregrinibacteria bacterium]
MTRCIKNVILGTDVVIRDFVNLYDCEVGDSSRIGTFVEIQKGVVIGKKCKIQSHAFLCEGVTIEDGCFIGHGVIFTNDRFPRAINEDGSLRTEHDWQLHRTLVKRGASIGSGTTILPGITIGEDSLIGAGSTVTEDVPPRAVVAGNPARMIRILP